MLRSFSIACALLSLSLGAIPLSAQSTKDVLKQLPKSTLGVTILNRLEKTSALAEKLGGQLHLQVFNPLGLAKIFLRIGAGLDDNGTAAVAFLPGDDENSPPVPILLVPVTDYAKFIEPISTGKTVDAITEIQLGPRAMLSAKKGNFAVLGQLNDGEVFQSFIASTESSVDTFEPLDAWLGSNEIVLLATPAGIRTATEKMAEGLEQAKAQMAAGPPEAAAAVVWMEKVGGILNALRSDVSLLGIGIDASDAGHLTASVRATFSATSSMARDAQASSPKTTPLLTDLPNGPFVFALGTAYLEQWTQTKIDLANEMLSASFKNGPLKLTDEQIKQMGDATADLVRQSRGLSMWSGVSEPNKGLFNKTVAVIYVDSSAKYLADLKNYLAVYEKISTEAGDLKLPKYDHQDVQVAGKSGISMTADMSNMFAGLGERGGPGASMLVDALMATIVGPSGKMNIVAVALDDKRIATGYSREAIDAYLAAPPKAESSLANDDVVKTSVALLPQDSQSIGLISPQGLIQIVNQTLKKLPMTQGYQVPKFPRTAPIGIGSNLAAQGYELRLVVPTDAVTAIGEVIDVVRNPDQPGAPKDAP